MKLHEKIKVLRKKRGISQQDMADLLGIHLSHTSRLENGHYKPSFEVLRKLTEIFNVSADYLINDDLDHPDEIKLEDKNLADRLQLLNGLEDFERKVLLEVIDAMLTRKQMREVLQSGAKGRG